MDDTFEDMSFWEKITYKINQLKEDFLHLSVFQKIALIIAGSILVTILFYTFFTVTRLAQIKKISQSPSQTDQANTPDAAESSRQNEDKKSPETNDKSTVINKSSPSVTVDAKTPNSQTTGGIAGFVQNLMDGNNQASSNSNSTEDTITGITGASDTPKTSNTQNSQSAQPQFQQPSSVPQQPYIVNFLNGLLYFQDPITGDVTPYILSGVSPSDYTWARYTNPTDGYSIEYPTNWAMVKRIYNGHEGLSLYPPEENPANNDAKQIGLGWSARYLLPTAGGSEIYYQTSITISNTLGQLYTLGGGDQGARGTAVLLPHRFGYFGMGGSADTSAFIYVFQHMLSSLTLTK